MAYVTPTTRSDGFVVTAERWNQEAVDNPIALRTGAVAIASQAANDLIYASSASQLARLAAGTAGKVLQTNGAGSAPTWVTPVVVSSEQTTTATGAQNNFDLTERWTYLRCTGAAPVFSGFTVAGAAPQGGDRVTIECLGTTAKVTHQDAGSTAENRIICPSTNGQIVGANGRIELIYDTTTDRWREALVDPGGAITYTPTWTGSGSNPAIGAGTLTGSYQQRGRVVWVEIRLVYAADSTEGTGTYGWSTPINPSATYRGAGSVYLLDTGTANYIGTAVSANTNVINAYVHTTNSAGQVGAGAPMTWAANDALTLAFEYPIA